MSAIRDIIDTVTRNLERFERHEFDELDCILARHRHHHHRHHPAVRGRFSGFYHVNPVTGEITMASQAVQLNVAYTSPITFTDAAGNAVPSGATNGALALDNPANGTVGLSADGQSANVIFTALPASLSYSGTNSVGAPISVTAQDFALADPAVAGTFGTFVPGTTA